VSRLNEYAAQTGSIVIWSTLIAHGALGPYDEIILPLLGLGFVGAVLVTWLRSRQESPAPPSASSAPNAQDANADDDSHFQLD
jgi:hypothetical protein